MKAKIKDVAILAGVSTTTVSHVINQTRFVSEETVKKVKDAIEELGYTPDYSAKGLKTGKRMMIGFIVPDITNPVFSLLIECVENTVSQEGYKLVVFNSRDSVEKEKNAIRSLSAGVVDGLVIATSAKCKAELEDCLPELFPLVFVDRELSDFPQDSSVLDCQTATVEMISSLIEEGHEKIGYIVGIPHISPTKDRVTAYEEAFREKQLSFDPEMIRFLERSKSNAISETGYLLKKDCTAIIGTNTMITHDILNVLENSAPESKKLVRVCGFSDSYLAERFNFRIPTVDEPVEAMGTKAGEMILAKIADSHRVFPVERIPCRYQANDGV